MVYGTISRETLTLILSDYFRYFYWSLAGLLKLLWNILLPDKGLWFTQTFFSFFFYVPPAFFRRLKTKEKAIHKQLYLAMLIQVVVRLILYTDQFVSRKDQTVGGSEGTNQEETRGIDNTVRKKYELRIISMIWWLLRLFMYLSTEDNRICFDLFLFLIKDSTVLNLTIF